MKKMDLKNKFKKTLTRLTEYDTIDHVASEYGPVV